MHSLRLPYPYLIAKVLSIKDLLNQNKGLLILGTPEVLLIFVGDNSERVRWGAMAFQAVRKASKIGHYADFTAPFSINASFLSTSLGGAAVVRSPAARLLALVSETAAEMVAEPEKEAETSLAFAATHTA